MDNGDQNGEAPPAPAPGVPSADPSELSVETREKIIAALNQRFPNSALCTCCGKSGLGLANHFVTPTIIQPGGGVMLGGMSYPQIMLICTNCGFTRHHNAVVLGVYNEP